MNKTTFMQVLNQERFKIPGIKGIWMRDPWNREKAVRYEGKRAIYKALEPDDNVEIIGKISLKNSEAST